MSAIEQAMIADDRSTILPSCPKCKSERTFLQERWKLPDEVVYRGYSVCCYGCGWAGAQGTVIEAIAAARG